MDKVKKIAIYLPQFHAIPENDAAWGKGFTEWTNVKKAQPLFYGHYQPHVPHESIGYYDLSNPKVLIKQAKMAKDYGIYGFAYYHYWFNGKRLLNKPLDEMLSSGKPDMPFCYIWANENWTRRWDGANNDIIIKQEYSFEDDLKHIRFLCEKVFSDKRYIFIEGKPLFLVYRTELFPDIKRTSEIWRTEVKNYGYKDLYLVRMENFERDIDPITVGFDAAMEFGPVWANIPTDVTRIGNKELIDYLSTVINTIKKVGAYKYFHCVFPGWDNTPRRKNLSGSIFINNDVEVFKYFLEKQIKSTHEGFQKPDERLIFINAWNEWGEGCHIEPDEKNGFKYLEVCRDAQAYSFNGLTESLIEKIFSLEQRNQLLINKYNLLESKYNHTINTRYYKVGKKIQTTFTKMKKLIK